MATQPAARPFFDRDSVFDRDLAHRRLQNLVTAGGLVLDRQSDPERISVAGCGFQAAAAVDIPHPDRPAIAEQLTEQLDRLVRGNPAANGGWFSHFTDRDGLPIVGSEVSTIDTALLLAGHRVAARVLRDPNHAALLDRVAGDVDLAMVTVDGWISHGFRWPELHGVGDREPIAHLWKDTSECALLYWLFGERMIREGLRRGPWEPEIVRTDYPLFVYVYPLCFDDRPNDPGQRHRWRSLLIECLERQRSEFGVVGQTATDGPDGYSVGSPSVVAPVLLAALAGDPGLPHVRESLERLRSRGIDPMAMCHDVDSGWTGDDVISIDIGSAILAARAIRERGELR